MTAWEAWDGTRAIPGSIEDRVVRAFDVSVPAPSLADPRGDLDRALDSLEAAHGLDEREMVAVRGLNGNGFAASVGTTSARPPAASPSFAVASSGALRRPARATA